MIWHFQLIALSGRKIFSCQQITCFRTRCIISNYRIVCSVVHVTVPYYGMCKVHGALFFGIVCSVEIYGMVHSVIKDASYTISGTFCS